MALSPLTRVIVPVLELARREQASSIDPGTVERVIVEHGGHGESPPNWMMAWFSRVARGEVSPRLFQVPVGYPTGESGLANILADIEETIVPLGIADDGESFVWIIPRAGLKVLTIRETAGEWYYGAMRPIGSDVNKWLLEQYRQLRLGGLLARLD